MRTRPAAVSYPKQAAAVLDALGRDALLVEVESVLARFHGAPPPGLAERARLWRGLSLDADHWRLTDLRPPQKQRRLNRAGRTLRITPEMLIAGTTGIGHPLGDPVRVTEYVARGERGKLARRLESDLKALHAFYRYGVLHGCVRLRWGFIDEPLAVD